MSAFDSTGSERRSFYGHPLRHLAVAVCGSTREIIDTIQSQVTLLYTLTIVCLVRGAGPVSYEHLDDVYQALGRHATNCQWHVVK